MEKIELNKTNLEAWQIGNDDLELFHENLKTKKEEIEKKFQEDNKELIEKIEKLSTEQSEEKEQFREQAIELYKNTKEKKLLGGIGIREMGRLIYENDKAYAWAKDHSLCLLLDKKAFEKIVKTEQFEFDFVGKEKQIIATFPRRITFGDPENVSK